MGVSMNKVLKIIKINLLAIIAFPLLVLATAAKLAAKAMEKTVTIIGAIFILLGIALIFEIMKSPSEFLSGFFIVIICLILGGVFTAIAILILQLISTIVMAVVAVIISLLNNVYELVYAGYAALYHTCKTDYAQISQSGNGFLNGLSCLFFTLLRVVNRVIILFVTHAIKLLMLACVVIVIGSLVLCNQAVQESMGINLLAYMKLFSAYPIVYGCVIYVATMIAVVVILMSLGLEWSEWGSEMELSTSDYESYMNSIMEAREDIGQEDIQGIHGLDEKRLEKCMRYQSTLRRHVTEIETFAQRILPTVEKSDNYILRSNWNEYFSKLQEAVNLYSKFEDGVPVEEFEKLMPMIDELEELQETIEKQVARAQMEQNSSAATGSGFFAGCDTPEKLEKRYRALCKTYHPDTEAGDEDTFKRMTEEYEKLKGQMNG
ncbi:MAG: hypothetical protein K2H45_12030 [Acetatifactor sp.]|nr:hypothetical protein [Acetatifactor sp.]